MCATILLPFFYPMYSLCLLPANLLCMEQSSIRHFFVNILEIKINKGSPHMFANSWWNFSVQSMHKLNVAYNNAFRFMHHLPTYCSASLMFVVNRVPNCRAVIRNRIYGFMKRLVSSSNALVLSTVTSDARFRSRIVRHWLKSLYIHFDAG